MKNKEIGGFFSLELPSKKKHFHLNSIKLNSCRSALEYILRIKKPTIVYIPYYICGVMLEPFINTNIRFKYYSLNKNLELLKNINLEKDEYLLYVNYFGIKNSYIDKLIHKYKKKLIIDSSQSFFSKYKKIYSIYSPRKFFGVSDGGYLTGNFELIPLDRDISINRMRHLLGRLDLNANIFYDEYKKNDDQLSSQPIKKMSLLTESILKSINYNKVKKIRNKNFMYLHKFLKYFNKLDIEIDYIDGPMVYPFLYKEKIKKKLIKNKIYVATYWNDILNIDGIPSTEVYLTKNIIPLPIDQRYGIDDMKKIVKIIEESL